MVAWSNCGSSSECCFSDDDTSTVGVGKCITNLRFLADFTGSTGDVLISASGFIFIVSLDLYTLALANIIDVLVTD